MNAAVAFALVSLLLQVVSQYSDRRMEKIELSLFRHQVRQYEPLGVRKWFSDTSGNDLGEGRSKTVLRMAMLSASVRETLTSLLICLLGLVATIWIISTAEPTFSFFPVRIITALVFTLVIILVTFDIFIRISSIKIKAIPVDEDRSNYKKRFKDALMRLRKPEYMTIHKVLILVTNFIVILLALEL